MRTVLAAALMIPVLGAGGCVNLADAVSERMSDPPEWFEAARREMRGEDYPDIRKVPALLDPPTDHAAWEADATSLRGDAEEIATDPRGAPAEGLTGEELRARAAQLRALTEAPPPR